jgi:hypothetical protein
VNDQSLTGVVTSSPLSQSPGVLHDQDSEAFAQSRGSKPVARSVTSSKIMQMNIAPPIFNIVFITTSNG